MADIGINFKLKSERGYIDYAFKVWPSVPSKGDIVMLNDPKREKDFRYPAKVLLVVWGIREESWAGKQLECDVYITWDDNMTINSD